MPLQNEKPFRPSTELDVEWLTERPANLRPIVVPDIFGPQSEWSKAMHARIAALLIESNPFGIEIIDDDR